MVDAVQRGGGMVDIPIAANEKVCALLASGIPVIFSTREIPDDDSATVNDSWTSHNDNDLGLDFF